MRDEWMGVEDVLAELPRSNPDTARSQRVRARCHAAMTRRRGGQVKAGSFSRAVESAVVGGFCAVYLCALTLIALHSHGVL
ncbi:MAG: hypothetical protein ABIP90_04320 [Vicinamibacterales bacterium]